MTEYFKLLTQLGSHEKLDKEALRDGDSLPERCACLNASRDEQICDFSREETSSDLDRREDDGTVPSDVSREHERRIECRIEETAANSEKGPNINSQRKSEAKRRVLKLGGIQRLGCCDGG